STTVQPVPEQYSEHSPHDADDHVYAGSNPSSTVKNNTSPSSKLLNVVYAPKNPTVRNKRRVGPMKSVASANGVTKARMKAPVRLMNRISYGQPFPSSA